MLVRSFVGKKLTEYYSQPSNKVIGSSNKNIQLSSLWGEWHWLRVYGRMYREQEGQWLTPVELFRPHYSNILANFVVECTSPQSSSDTIHIVELGGGRGTNANGILSHLQEMQPDLYDRVSYTIIDASEPLLELQKTVLSSSEHSSKVDFVYQDLMEVAEEKATLLEESTDPTVILAMELLDNLPHDKIRRNRKLRSYEQCEVKENAEGELIEVFVPMTDELLLDMIETAPSFGGTVLGRQTWVPSVACGVLRHIRKLRPKNLSLALADFDYLPPPDIVPSKTKRRSKWATGEPIITSMDGLDHECYLDAPPFCDVLFPTDFGKLALFAKKCFGQDVEVKTMKQAQFLLKYGAEEVNATKSWLTGYSPLIHDFENCSVLTVTPKNSEQ